MPWVYKINARSFYLNGSYQFMPDILADRVLKMTLLMSV